MKKLYILILLLSYQTGFTQMINLEQYVTGLSAPTDIANAGDDRLFVVERRGKVRIIDKDGNLMPTPFIDIDNMVSNASGQDERGCLGIAFHPDYKNNGYFFLNHTDNDDHTNVVRYTVDPTNPDLADPSSRELIIKIEQPYWNHNGGGIKFGPDGYLYIGMGDGGAGDDPQNFGQNRQSLLGKMLRIDVDNGLPYTIPADNPFVADDSTLDEIWAIGMRNPWRFSFDKLNGDLWIGDVGQGQFEEVDYEPAGDAGGHNYGWRCYEGTDFTNNSSMADCTENYVEPVYEIAHQGFSGPCSLTGGYVYRGSKFPDLVGKYICTDYCTGQFFTVAPDGNGGWDGNEVVTLNFGISTFGEDIKGELYVATLSSGRIYKVQGEIPEPPKYNNAESAEYDPINKQWLISNGDEMIADDGEGNLSVFGSSAASYGMEVLGNTIFGVYGNNIVGVDLTTQEQVMNITISGSSFLNGMTNDGISKLYVSDFGSKRIYMIDVSDLSSPFFDIIVDNTVQTPNGVFFDGSNNRLLYTTWESDAKVKAVDLATFDQTTIVSTGAGQIDGIDDDSAGNYYLSSWNPAQIIKYNNDFTQSVIVSTPPLSSPADIGINKETNILGIPMGDNVIFVQLDPTNTKDDEFGVSFEVATNPISTSSILRIELKESQNISASLFDIEGRLVRSLFESKLSIGKSEIPFEVNGIASGMYIIMLSNAEGQQSSKKVIIE